MSANPMNRLLSLLAVALATAAIFPSPSPAQTIRLEDGWKFAFGNAASPEKDFGSGTEYFNYLTKANSIHNRGPYTLSFDDSAWADVSVPHDWVAGLGFSPEASH